MKISYKWIKEYVDIQQDAYAVADALTMSGTETEEIVHQTVPQEVICALVKEVKRHPDADKLTICTVDTGAEQLQVICGAPNVRQGMKSAFAPVGTDLGPDMKVKKAKIRGVESFGILLSEKELGLTDDHSGIMDLEGDVKVGDILVQALDLEDWVLNLNVTPNRGDCLSVIGIARELSVLYKKDLRTPKFTIKEEATPIGDVLSVEIQAPDACPRYSARLMQGVHIRKSPFYMRRRLFQSGVRSINNIVDITNYVLLEYGQPLHAFDYTLIADRGIVVRKAHDKEVFVTLDSTERKLGKDDLLICDRKRPVALAGIMGGENSEVKDTTTNIALESAFFDPVGIRRTAKALNISTEASYRFERGIDPLVQVEAANRASYLMAQYADAKVLSGFIDVNYINLSLKEILLRKDYLEKVLGIKDIPGSEVEDIFTRLGCIINKKDNAWLVKPPLFRHDITREIDLVEEFIRIYGMDKVKPELPTFKPIKFITEEMNLDELRTKLTPMGLSEAITYSFISPRWQKWFGQEMLELKNPISDDMKFMRTSLIPGLCSVVERNKNLQSRDIQIFEVGKCFYPRKPGELPCEQQRLGIAITGQRYDTHWSDKPRQVDFYDSKGIAEAILPGILMSPSQHPFFKDGIQADIYKDSTRIGYIGSLHADILAMLDMQDDVFVMEISIELMFEKKWQGIKAIPKYPMTWRDLSLVVDEGTSYTDIVKAIEAQGIKELKRVIPIDLYKGDKLPGNKKGITIRITYQSDTRTLEEKMINKWQDSIIKSLDKDLGIALRQ